ncbi:hypothetical protein HYH02_009884 [Chlamydomonas schloesseri]|uniref:Uncharacterized protein n=1 Tax=Chlamydomonas schloesseri TaxID=2026947 RepID=A0A835TM75_9CHLO|nr:hypothetical protein HYH02_009884 [Chlamydomonas schloesseri]|eukprot:KAG2441291.1 hypothetical protein HYH02_009884 [Chlamydomonas schloesseri]
MQCKAATAAQRVRVAGGAASPAGAGTSLRARNAAVVACCRRRAAAGCAAGCRCARHSYSPRHSQPLSGLTGAQGAAPRAVVAAAAAAAAAGDDPRGVGPGHGAPGGVPEEWQDEWMSGVQHEGGGGGGGGVRGGGGGTGAGQSELRKATGDQVPEAWADEWQSGNPAIEQRDPTTITGGSSSGGGSSGSSSSGGGINADTEQEIPDANIAGLSSEDFGGPRSGGPRSGGPRSGPDSAAGATPTAAHGTAAETSGVDVGRLADSLAGGLGARDAGPMDATRQAAAGGVGGGGGGGGEREDEDEPYSSHRRRGNWMT